MARKSRRNVIVAVAYLLFATSALAQVTIVPDPARTIHVTGRGALSVDPDTATVTLGVAARNQDLKTAKATVDSTIQRLIALAVQLHIGAADLKTSGMNVVPQYRDDTSEQFLGYDVTRSVTVSLRELQRLEQLLDGAIEAGANREFDVTLSSSREAQLKQEALSKAITDAKAQAEYTASRFGLRVGAVRSVSLNKVSGAFSTSAGYVTRTARFLPGQITVDAEASVSFILEEIERAK